MNQKGINQGTSGNISARLSFNDMDETFLITPSGVPYSDLTPEMLVMVKITDSGDEPEIVDGPFDNGTTKKLSPSTEWRLHRDIYMLKKEEKEREIPTWLCHKNLLLTMILACFCCGCVLRWARKIRL